jgi:iron complex transport system ATP-binding protein
VTPVLTTRHLTVGYPATRRRGERIVLEGLGLAARAGELTCLLGPNGSGKSTLLRTLAGMQPALAGEVALCGDPLDALSMRERARRLAVVLTDGVDAGSLRAVDLVALGRHPHTGWDGRLRPADHEAVRWALAAVGATPLAERDVAALSDGERQRVLIARALAQQPRLLALDEPVAFVDVARRLELTALLRDLAAECELGVVLTTHDIDLALRTADTVWLIEPRPGLAHHLHVGAPEDLVLSGAVDRAFASEAVRFDVKRGRFADITAPLGTARIEGDGIEARWAGRVVERQGLALDPAATALVVTAHGGGRWTVAAADARSEHRSLDEVGRRVRALLPTLASASDHSET